MFDLQHDWGDMKYLGTKQKAIPCHCIRIEVKEGVSVVSDTITHLGCAIFQLRYSDKEKESFVLSLQSKAGSLELSTLIVWRWHAEQCRKQKHQPKNKELPGNR